MIVQRHVNGSQINRGDNRFYFGRYTGLTPVPGQEKSEKNTNPNILRLQNQLEKLQKQAEKAKETEKTRYFFPSTDPDASEMWSRWDMQDHPPDILITNYSMLNIMLTRDLEQPIFEKTKEWLKEPDSVFHLVVDELHSYRGTAGSEVLICFGPYLTVSILTLTRPKLTYHCFKCIP